MHTIQLNKKPYFIPSAWDEVSALQMLNIAQPLLLQKTVWVFLLLSKIPLKLWNQIEADIQADMLKLIDFTNEFPTISPVQAFTCKKTKFNAHAEALEDMSFNNFAYADMYFMAIAKGEDIEKNINKLTACIFLSDTHKALDKFCPKQIDKDARKLESAHPYYKLCAIIFYRGCREKLIKDYGVLFESSGNQDPDGSFGPSKPNFGFFGMLNDISKSGQYGTYAQTCETNIHIILTNRVMDVLNADKK